MAIAFNLSISALEDANLHIQCQYKWQDSPLVMNAKYSFAVDRQRPAGRWRSYIAVSWDKHSREASARYLRQMIDKFGAIHLAVAAYNAGPGIQVDRRAALPSLRQNFLRA